MINNRQNGRRRGRGGGPRSPGNAPNSGNRQDNRSRGNAAQLHEKYKALARDAQLSGDRIQTEYYLQFADHYFRILNENRMRYEEQRRPRDDAASGEEDDRDENREAFDDAGEEQRHESAGEDPQYQEHQRRPSHEYRERGQHGQNRVAYDTRMQDAQDGEARDHYSRDRMSSRGSLANDARYDETEADEEARIALDSLPPAITPIEDNDTPPAPRRRTRRRNNDDGDTEVAPAA